MSGLHEWAINEVNLACEKEKKNSEGDDWKYGVGCYKSALKAFESLLDDGHSGMSVMITKSILNRLIEDKPLTPLENKEDQWDEPKFIDHVDGAYTIYHHKRYHSLSKKVYEDKTVEYIDSDRFSFHNIDHPEVSWLNNRLSKIMSEYYPITFPYMPDTKPIRVYINEFLSDSKNGDYDHQGILYSVRDMIPMPEIKHINRFFKYTDGSFTEIESEEYDKSCEESKRK